MAQQALFTPNRALDANAYAQPGATATFYASGTNTLITVYSDEAGTIATTNPITADGNGVFAQAFVNEEAKVVVKDADGATLWTIDPCPATSGDATGASAIPFTPTVDLPFTNVQDAVEGAAALSISGAADFGLGITGNAPTIGNIDATAQASGVFRFTGTTTGTFPSGITASTTGLVRLDRQTAAEAVMMLRAAGQSRIYYRFLASTTWGAWLEMPTPLADPGADRIRFWDDSAGAEAYLSVGQGLEISGTTLSANKRFAAANINTRNQPTGTYSQTGTTITVTMVAHGMTTGQGVYLDFTSGTASDAFFQITVLTADTYTVTAPSATTSGNVTRRLWARAYSGISSMVPSGTSTVTVTFAATQPDTNYVIMGLASTDVGNQIPIFMIVESAPPTTTGFVFDITWETGSGGGADTAAWAFFTCDRV